ITSSITVATGGVLNIDPGMTLKFASGTMLNVAGGMLQIDASAAGAPAITFTTASSPAAPGQWVGIYIQSGSAILKNVMVAYAGQNIGYGSFGVRIDAGSPTLDHVTIDHS